MRQTLEHEPRGESVAQVSNLLYRRFPIGRMFRDSPRSNACGAGGLEIRDTADWKSALPPSFTPRAAPAPIFRPGAQPRGDRIVSNVPCNSGALVIISHPMIKRFGLPETSCRQPEIPLCPQRGELLPTLHEFAHNIFRHRPEQNVDMIGHHNPFPQDITLLVEKPHRAGNKPANFGPAQMARSRSRIEVAFYLSEEFTVDGCLVVGRSAAQALGIVKGSKPLPSLAFVPQQHFSGQRIRQPERNEIIGPFPFHMRKIPSGVNTASLRIGGGVLDTARPKLIAHAFQSRVLRLRRHARNLSEASSSCNAAVPPPFVAQVSNLRSFLLAPPLQ